MDYVCPKCSQRTFYPTPDGLEDETECPKDRGFIEDEIPFCRRQIKAIKALSVKLDESSFCESCRAPGAKPQLVLIIRYPGEKPPHRFAGVRGEDLELIVEFLSGGDRHDGGQGGETPLGAHAERLRQVLGVDA